MGSTDHAAPRRGLTAAFVAGLAALAVLASVQATGYFHGWAFSWARELSVALVILFSAWSAGKAAIRATLGGPPQTDVFVEAALGLGLLASATFAMGVLGVLHPVGIAALVALASVPAAARAWTSRKPLAPCEDPAPTSWPSWPGCVAVAAILGCGFLYASLPPAFYDTLVYHFGLPDLYLATGALTYWNGSYLACYPQNSEMLDVIAIAFGGEKAAQILGFGIACLVVLAVRRMARREAGAAGADLAFVFLVSQWPFWFGAAFGKNDLTGALFLLAATMLALDPPPGRPLRALALAGALAGFGVGVKLTNGLPALLLGLSVAVTAGLAPRDRKVRAAVFLLAVFVTASPWLVRNTIYRGNPFFPAFYSVLGGRDFSPVIAKRMEQDTLQAMDRAPAAVMARVGSIGIDKQRFASGGELSLLTMPLLLAGLVFSRRRRSAVPLAIALITLVIGVGYLSAVVRTYAVAWAIVPLAAAVVFARFNGRIWRAAIAVIVVAAAVPGFLYSARMLETVSAGGSRVILGRVSPAQYLAECVNYLPIAEYANSHLAADARILVVGSARTAYFHRRADAPSAQDDAWIAKASRPLADRAALRAELRRMGYTHVLLNTQELRASEPARRAAGILNDPEAAARLDQFFRALHPVAMENECVLFDLGGA